MPHTPIIALRQYILSSSSSAGSISSGRLIHRWIFASGRKLGGAEGLLEVRAGVTQAGVAAVADPVALGDAVGEGVDHPPTAHAILDVQLGIRPANREESVLKGDDVLHPSVARLRAEKLLVVFPPIDVELAFEQSDVIDEPSREVDAGQVQRVGVHETLVEMGLVDLRRELPVGGLEPRATPDARLEPTAAEFVVESFQFARLELRPGRPPIAHPLEPPVIEHEQVESPRREFLELPLEKRHVEIVASRVPVIEDQRIPRFRPAVKSLVEGFCAAGAIVPWRRWGRTTGSP